MRPVEIIRAVRDQKALDGAELRQFIADISAGKVADYQATAFLMAVYFRGLSPELTVAMTLAMRDSGDVIDLHDIKGIKVDKHSTGGVGDKISVPLAPLVAACGVPVPMISGRGLGHTGGTLDKLESIPGFRVDLDVPTFKKTLQALGVCLIGQTGRIAPADKKLYALRDVTATVESIPLITSSILSKKLAAGIDALVLDVKVGQGAFMKDETTARQLAQSLVRVGTGAGLKVRAILTRMEAPLGRMIGNALEVRESLDILRGKGPADTTELTMVLGAHMLCMGGVCSDVASARRRLEEAVRSGAALQKFRDIIQAQGGDVRIVDQPDLLPTARYSTDVAASEIGYVTHIDSYALGILAMELGAGRARAEDTIDFGVGLELHAKVGDHVDNQKTIVTIFHNAPLNSDIVKDVQKAFKIGNAPVAESSLIIDEIT